MRVNKDNDSVINPLFSNFIRKNNFYYHSSSSPLPPPPPESRFKLSYLILDRKCFRLSYSGINTKLEISLEKGSGRTSAIKALAHARTHIYTHTFSPLPPSLLSMCTSNGKGGLITRRGNGLVFARSRNPVTGLYNNVKR